MKSRALGQQGLRVSPQGLGCMGMSQTYGQADESESLATLQRALQLGVTFWDTSNVYGDAGAGGFGANERLLGKALVGRRDEITLATKVGIESVVPEGKLAFRLDACPENVRSRCEESLRRLGTDYIDLYYLHRVDPQTPIEDSVGAMAELITEGKVRYLGLSEVTVQELERAHVVHPISALQSEWSIWTRGIEDDVLPAARRLGVGIVPYAPLGRGFFTGALAKQAFDDRDSRGRLPRFSDENLVANEAIVDEIRAIADSCGARPGQVALAWVHYRGEDVVPIPGTKRIEYLEQNIQSLGVELDEQALAVLDSLAARVVGTRY